jgi:ribosomal-protein-alanine N-acetyltransferase
MATHSPSSIRRARPGDGPVLSSLQTHLRHPAPDLLSRALNDSHRRRSSTVSTGGSPLTLLVSTAEDVPVGYLLAVGSGPTHVTELVVDPAYRRSGRGSALLRSIRERCGDDRVTLLVDPENEPAVSCYRRLGFVVDDHRPDHFPDGDAVLMTWDPVFDDRASGEADAR